MALRPHPAPTSITPWLITFSDLLLLLLSSFVLKLSMSSLQPDISISQAAATRVAQERYTADQFTARLVNIMKPFKEPYKASNSEELKASDVTIEKKGENILVRLGQNQFLPGSRELSENSRSLIKALAYELRTTKHTVQIEGHTDPTPISTPEFPSNWELSAARAISVATELMNHGFKGEHISAVGYADTRPLVENETDDGKAKNRRVEILIK